MKRTFALILVMALVIACIPYVACAENEHGAVEHTIIIEVPPATENPGSLGSGNLGSGNIGGGDSPDIWGQDGFTLDSGYTLYTLSFDIPDRYFAFETYGNGNVNAVYNVSLVRNYTVLYSSQSNYANGVVDKNDWITVDPGSNYQFRISNYSGYTLYIHITYYSWQ